MHDGCIAADPGEEATVMDRDIFDIAVKLQAGGIDSQFVCNPAGVRMETAKD